MNSQEQIVILPYKSGINSYEGEIIVEQAGMWVINFVSPRSIRFWWNGELLLDEALDWRSFQREIRAAAAAPCKKGIQHYRMEVEERPTAPQYVTDNCPSRNRVKVMKDLEELRPDQLRISLSYASKLAGDQLSIRYLPAQFKAEGRVWQHIHISSAKELSCIYLGEDESETSGSIRILSTKSGSEGKSITHIAVSIGSFDEVIPVKRSIHEPDARVEPYLEIVSSQLLTVAQPCCTLSFQMPIYETLGLHAPQLEYKQTVWPTADTIATLVPRPILPPKWHQYGELYDAAWRMLMHLVREPKPESGLPNAYISTGSQFIHNQFVWDTSFTAMCTAYAGDVLPLHASLNIMYSTQFMGGYIHREMDVRDSLPVLFEPDFGPNPPLLALAEWKIASVTGDVERVAKVYPLLKEHHGWIASNRKLANGTYWTTGLANGLDNSPSLGEGYPCLTSQMAHDAEILGKMANLLGKEAEADEWFSEVERTNQALNQYLWDDTTQIYTASLPWGGHNPNKVVTTFWPLWAGIAPDHRVDAIAEHLVNPNAFWRHHPVPSLSADSPLYDGEGDYWRGSVWSPTNYMVNKGLERVNKRDLAIQLAFKHLDAMTDVYKDTGYIWENYAADASARGNISMSDYSWSALGPIAVLFELIIGIELDALTNTIYWIPPASESIGVERLRFGSGIVTFRQEINGDAVTIHLQSSHSFHLKYCWKSEWHAVEIPIGESEFSFNSQGE